MINAERDDAINLLNDFKNMISHLDVDILNQNENY